MFVIDLDKKVVVGVCKVKNVKKHFDALEEFLGRNA